MSDGTGDEVVTLKLSGSVPPEIWNRLCAKIFDEAQIRYGLYSKRRIYGNG